jgi:hypothetical protein
LIGRPRYFGQGGTIQSIERIIKRQLEDIMKKFAFIIAASAFAALIMGAAAAFAQTTGPDAPSAVTAKVKNWTTERWNAAKADWAKDKIRWADCQQRSTDRKLAGRESWSFLYTCMTTPS